MSGPAPDLVRALVRWQRAAGPYWPYVCAAPFVADAPPIRRHRRHVPHRPGAALALLRRLQPAERSALFFDLPPTAILPSAPVLHAFGFHLVPVIQRWPTAPAVLPCGLLLEQLVDQVRRFKLGRLVRGVAFLLDGERAGPPSPPSDHQAPRRAFDNRYTYRADRFPPPDFLRREGIDTVRWLTPAGIAPDLLAYARQLAEAGFPVQVHSTARVRTPSPAARGARPSNPCGP